MYNPALNNLKNKTGIRPNTSEKVRYKTNQNFNQKLLTLLTKR